MSKTISEINEKIKAGKAVVFTAEEIIEVAREKGVKKAARDVDVVTTGATVEACARALRAAGAREVRLVSAARVV